MPRAAVRGVGLSCFISDSVATRAVRGGGGPEHPDSGFKDVLSATQRPAKLVQQTEEDVLPGIPRQQPIDDLPPRARGSAPERSSSRAGTWRSPSATASVSPPGAAPANGPPPATPAPPRPSGSRPASAITMYAQFAQQVVHRRRQRPHAALELRQQVLLVAAVVGRRRRSPRPASLQSLVM